MKAYKVLSRLRDTPVQAARDLYYIHAQYKAETKLFASDRRPEEGSDDDGCHDQQYIHSLNYLRRFLQLFRLPRNRTAAAAACVVMASQQLSGINIFAFLAATFFSNANPGGTDIDSLWLTFGFGAANALSSPLAYWLIDTKGRRFLLLASLICMIPFLLAMGFAFKIEEEVPKTVAVVILLVAYTACYSPGAGVIPFLYSSEVSRG